MNPALLTDGQALLAPAQPWVKPNRRTWMQTALGVGYAAAALPVVAQNAVKTSGEGLVHGEVMIDVAGFQMPAYRSAPAGQSNLPVVLVVSEIFGVHEYIADVTRRLAHQGYLARRGALRTPTDMLQHDLIGGDTDATILQGFQAMGFPVTREAFAIRTDDLIVQWRAVQAGLGIGFVADYMARTDPDIVRVLPGQLTIPPLPMWLAVHREIRTNQRIRAVYDFLAESLPDLL